MVKIDKADFVKLKEEALDIFTYPKGNFWIIHSKVDGKFYPIKHCKCQYWTAKPTKYFTEVLRAMYSVETGEFQNPANQKIFSM